MAGAIDRAAITLKLNRETELKCYPPVGDFLKLLVDLLSGEAQGSFGDVIISSVTPGPDDVNKIWIEVNGQRNTFALKVYVHGKWQPYYFTPPSSYLLFDGRAPLPEGFKEIGRFKAVDVPVTGASTAGSLPVEFIIGSFVGY